MKKIVLNTLILLVYVSMASAQYTYDWTQSCGIYNKTAVMSTVDSDDNLIVTGYLQSENIYTRKYDKTGNFLWEAIDSSGLPSKYEKPIWINRDMDDNVFVIGKRYSISSGWEYPDAIVAVKYDPSGNFIWKQEIPVTVLIGSQHPAFNLRAEVDADGNLYIGTVAASPSGFVLSKISPSGTILFTHNTTTVPVNGFWSMRLGDDKIVLSGGGNLQAPISVWSLEGSLLWTAAPTGRGARDVEMDEGGNIYLLSSYFNQVSSNSGEDMVMYKFDASGNQLWKKDFDMGGYESGSMCVYTPGRLSITGYGYPSGSIYFDWQVLQVDTEGSLLWSAVYDSTAYNDEYPYFISADPQGNVFVTGRGGPSPVPGNLSAMQMVILQYTNEGSLSWSDTPNQYGGWGLACQLASDNSLYAISSAEMTVYHYNPPYQITSNFQLQDTACIAHTVDIIYTGNAPDTATYNWDFDGANVISGSGQGPYSVQWTSLGAKTVSLYVEESGYISDTSENDIIINENPVFTIIPYPNDTVTTIDTITLIADITSGSYLWSTGDTTQSIEVICTSGSNGGSQNYWLEVTNEAGCTGKEYISVVFEGPTLVSEFQANIGIVVYPNPFNDNLTVELNIVEEGQYVFEVYDYLGSPVNREMRHLSHGIQSINLNLNLTQQGVYILSVKSESGQMGVQKVIKSAN